MGNKADDSVGVNALIATFMVPQSPLFPGDASRKSRRHYLDDKKNSKRESRGLREAVGESRVTYTLPLGYMK